MAHAYPNILSLSQRNILTLIVLAVLGVVFFGGRALYRAHQEDVTRVARENTLQNAPPAVPICDPSEPTLVLPYPGPNGARHDVRTVAACMSRLYRFPDGVEWTVEHGGIVHLETWSGRRRISQDAPGDVWHGNIENLGIRLWGGGPVTIVLRRKAPVAEGIVQAAFPSSPQTTRSTAINVEPVCDTAHTYHIPVPENSEREMTHQLSPQDSSCWTGVIITPPEFTKGFGFLETEGVVEIALSNGQIFPLAPNGHWDFRGQQAFRLRGEGTFVLALQDRVIGGSGASTASALPVSRRPRDPENEKVLSWLLPDRRP